MTPITREALEAAGFKRLGKNWYLGIWEVGMLDDGECYIQYLGPAVTTIEQIAEVCKLPKIPTAL